MTIATAATRNNWLLPPPDATDGNTVNSRDAPLDGPTHFIAMQSAVTNNVVQPQPTPAWVPGDVLTLFVARVGELLMATDEPKRRQLENQVLDLAVPLHAAGVFKSLNIAHPALASMVSDHLAESPP